MPPSLRGVSPDAISAYAYAGMGMTPDELAASAQGTSDDFGKLSLLDMALAWLALAGQADKNSKKQGVVL